jgi:hypothetical protein
MIELTVSCWKIVRSRPVLCPDSQKNKRCANGALKSIKMLCSNHGVHGNAN